MKLNQAHGEEEAERELTRVKNLARELIEKAIEE
jgi:hypothetical protein